MKLLILITSLLFVFTSADAQITKENWLVGGAGNFSFYENGRVFNGEEQTNSKGFGARLAPNVGYFFIDKLAAGIKGNLSYSNPNQGGNNSYGYAVGPFVRYYFLKPENTINILAHASYSFGRTIFENRNNISRENGYEFKAGPVIFFNQSVALEITLDYNKFTLASENASDSFSKYFQLGIGFQIHLEQY